MTNQPNPELHAIVVRLWNWFQQCHNTNEDYWANIQDSIEGFLVSGLTPREIAETVKAARKGSPWRLIRPVLEVAAEAKRKALSAERRRVRVQESRERNAAIVKRHEECMKARADGFDPFDPEQPGLNPKTRKFLEEYQESKRKQKRLDESRDNMEASRRC